MELIVLLRGWCGGWHSPYAAQASTASTRERASSCLLLHPSVWLRWLPRKFLLSTRALTQIHVGLMYVVLYVCSSKFCVQFLQEGNNQQCGLKECFSHNHQLSLLTEGQVHTTILTDFVMNLAFGYFHTIINLFSLAN